VKSLWRALILCLALAGCGSTAATPTQTTTLVKLTGPRARTGTCGLERWSVKTLTDPGAKYVNLTPRASSIARLDALAAPQPQPGERQPPIETATFTVKAALVYAKPEADHDYHLVLEGASGRTMIAEAPDPACAQRSRVIAQISAVRAALDAAVPGVNIGHTERPHLSVTVTGVGFFDRIHGQRGVAPNGIELHPITAITFTAAKLKLPVQTLTEKPGTD
jgi:hypothetical protein